MKNLREEIEKISKTYPIIKVMLFVDGFEDDLLNLFRSWVEDILIELRHIRANAPLTVGDGGRTRDRLRDLIEVIEGAK